MKHWLAGLDSNQREMTASKAVALPLGYRLILISHLGITSFRYPNAPTIIWVAYKPAITLFTLYWVVVSVAAVFFDQRLSWCMSWTSSISLWRYSDRLLIARILCCIYHLSMTKFSNLGEDLHLTWVWYCSAPPESNRIVGELNPNSHTLFPVNSVYLFRHKVYFFSGGEGWIRTTAPLGHDLQSCTIVQLCHLSILIKNSGSTCSFSWVILLKFLLKSNKINFYQKKLRIHHSLKHNQNYVDLSLRFVFVVTDLTK